MDLSEWRAGEVTADPNVKLEAATLAAGCFWCVEAALELYRNEEQRQIAEKSLAEKDASGDLRRMIVTEILPATAFVLESGLLQLESRGEVLPEDY